jgi:hypothetical protein
MVICIHHSLVSSAASTCRAHFPMREAYSCACSPIKDAISVVVASAAAGPAAAFSFSVPAAAGQRPWKTHLNLSRGRRAQGLLVPAVTAWHVRHVAAPMSPSEDPTAGHGGDRGPTPSPPSPQDGPASGEIGGTACSMRHMLTPTTNQRPAHGPRQTAACKPTRNPARSRRTEQGRTPERTAGSVPGIA